tara:strand:+ start:117 stop:518 length:402 start_codon:yes stop_codon:yes gene_type:complete
MEVFKLGNHYLKGIDLKNIKFNNDVEEEKRCFARLWGDGSFGNDRCEKSIKVGCLCKKHFEASQRMNGGWWLGMINEERPEEPEHPISGKHKWTKDINGNDYIIEPVEQPEEKVEEKKVKRPRGRPKGSKNKK